MLYEIGALGAFVGRTLTGPPEPGAFRQAADRILRDIERDTGWMYEAIDPDGITDRKRWSRPVTDADLALLDRIAQEPIPDCVPNVPIPWGDLYRRGYHQGITHLHHFWRAGMAWCRSI